MFANTRINAPMECNEDGCNEKSRHVIIKEHRVCNKCKLKYYNKPIKRTYRWIRLTDVRNVNHNQ